MKVIHISNNHNGLKISILFKSIIIDNIPSSSSFDEVMLLIKDNNGKEYSKAVYGRCRKITYTPQIIDDGKYSLLLYSKNKESRLYYSYLGDYDVIIQKGVNDLSFFVSPIFASNGIKLSGIPQTTEFLSKCLAHTHQFQCNDIQIKRLAEKITKGQLFPYGKLKAIHDWVAQNIYYDRDSLINDRYIQMDKSGLGVLTAKKGVCSGYSNLATALLRAVGIPAIGMLCFTLGISTEGGWFDNSNLNQEANHILTLAFISGRWIIMDVTWDSDNKYENGKFANKTGLGVSEKYFDSTIPFISSTHKFTEIVY